MLLFGAVMLLSAFLLFLVQPLIGRFILPWFGGTPAVWTTCLLFLLLRRMTEAFLRSALVAFLFALHPLHVESVAWVAQRSEVLSALFWFLTLWFYLRHVERCAR